MGKDRALTAEVILLTVRAKGKAAAAASVYAPTKDRSRISLTSTTAETTKDGSTSQVGGKTHKPKGNKTKNKEHDELATNQRTKKRSKPRKKNTDGVDNIDDDDDEEEEIFELALRITEDDDISEVSFFDESGEFEFGVESEEE